jgi:bromodomain and WD repeat domain-containing protein 1/3
MWVQIGVHISFYFIFLGSEMEDFLATSSSSSASNSSEESKASPGARESSLRSGVLRGSNLGVTRTRAARRKAGQ